MIDFKEVAIEDKELIESYTLQSAICNCDLSFANIFCWQPTYRSAWAIIENFLVIRFNIDGASKIGYMQPISLDGSLDFSHIIPQLAQDAHANNDRLRIIGITEQSHRALQERYCGEFAMHSDPNFEDYVYLRESLSTLSGKRLQPKRNHINQFLKQYAERYEYRELSPELFTQCLELDCHWRAAHGDCQCSPKTSPERDALERAFEHFDKLQLRGGALLVDDKVVAFTYGSAINSTTFCIHIEKASAEITGSYTIINRLFAESLPKHFTHINREEDLGIEGLRHAKLSYHPTHKEPKYCAIYLHHEERECKRLWREVFGDEESFIDEFLINHYRSDKMLKIAERDSEQEQHVAMLHIVDFRSQELGRIAYIYAVATAPKRRNRGLATQLLTAAIEQIKGEEYDAAILIPSASEPRLREFYSRCGFVDYIPSTNITFQSYNNFDFAEGETTEEQQNSAMILQITKKESSQQLPSHLILSK